MQQLLSTPTQATTGKNHQRCKHGYYVNAREFKTPICRTCDPSAHPLNKSETSYALALLALSREIRRRRIEGTGRFPAEATVEPGKYRCWCCHEVKPLDQEHFRRDSKKATGFQSRCKPCDNRRKTKRRQGAPRPGIEALLAVGVVL